MLSTTLADEKNWSLRKVSQRFGVSLKRLCAIKKIARYEKSVSPHDVRYLLTFYCASKAIMHKNFFAKMDCNLGSKENYTGLQLDFTRESDGPTPVRGDSSAPTRAPRFLVSTGETTPGFVVTKKAKDASAPYVDNEVITKNGVKLKIRDISKRLQLAVGNNKVALKP